MTAAQKLKTSLPAARRVEVDWREPGTLVAALPLRPGTVFLDSAMEHKSLGRWSYLAFDPFGHFVTKDGYATWNGARIIGSPISVLREKLRTFALDRDGAAPAFIAGATGYVSYEAGALFERLPVPRASGPAAPDIELWFHDAALVFDHGSRRSFIVSTGWPESDPQRRAARQEARIEWLEDWLSNASDAAPRPGLHLPQESWRSNMSRPIFEAAVARTRELILAGDIFQANIAQRFSAPLPSGWDPLGLYAQLRAANPATFGAFIAGSDQTILSMSPERFLRLRGDRAETRPIKGTRPRAADPAEDRRLADELVASEKDRAENVMIVDLLRNDLSRVARPGTVDVPVLCGLESYASVHHLVSSVTAQLRNDADALDLLAACFPGGSITGAPKIRAMEIIHALEPDRRGVYCGSIAHFGFDGSLDSNIAIRTLVCTGNEASFHAGGGITLLSDPADEYDETLVKARRVFEALAKEFGAMILVIDNYDSFVFNVARYVEELGETAIVRRNDALDVAAIERSGARALILSPGPCTPVEAGISLEAVRLLSGKLPILGICLGHQCIGQAFGAHIVRAKTPMHGRASTIRSNGQGLFAGLPARLEAGRYHSLIVEMNGASPEIKACAWSEEGEVMALMHRRHPTFGVQFHPESVLTPHGYDIMRAFLERVP